MLAVMDKMPWGSVKDFHRWWLDGEAQEEEEVASSKC